MSANSSPRQHLPEPSGSPALDSTALPAATVAHILDDAIQGVIVHRGGAPLFVNRTMRAMAGVSEGSPYLNRPVLDWIHPADRARVAAFMQARLAGRNAPCRYEFRLIRADGGEIWLDCRASVIEWADGPVILANCYDITPHKHTKRAQERSEALFRRVFQATPDMVSLSWLDTGIFLDVNDNLARAIGMSREEILGQSIFDLGIWEDAHMAMRIRAGVRRNKGSIRHMEGRIRRRDDSVFPVKFSAETLRVDDAEILLIIGRDITEEKKAEAALRAGLDAAELANRAKSEFLANMSHELRTPLNAILGFAEIIRDEVLGPIGDRRYRDYAADIHRSGGHLLDIINDILDLSKVEAGRLELHPAPVAVVEAVALSVRLVGERARTAGLEVESRVTPESLTIEADPRLFKQILLNLLSNAVKFTPEGGTVCLLAEGLPDGGCRLVVSDTGQGMTEEEIALALTPFGQVDSSMTRRREGTGLGLPLVAAFVGAHGGRLEIDSRKGAGTQVVVTFPAGSKDALKRTSGRREPSLTP